MGTGGLSRPRLDRLHDVMAGFVEQGEAPGIVTLVWRRGEVHVDAIGTKAFGGEPMRRDTIFRVASLTKPVTAVAAMILVEECKQRLDEPIDAWLPELADRKVLRSLESALNDTVPANRPITVRDLLTFRLGIGAIFAPPGQYPIQAAMDEAGVTPGAELPAHPPDELMRRFGSLPLLHQPGEGWRYNSGADILGVLIARVSGQSLSEFMQERIFVPLGMKDTGFRVPAPAIDRLSTAYQTDFATGNRTVFDEARGGRWDRASIFESGAGGLASTVDDYLAFGQMMLNFGTLNGTRILSRPSVEIMTTDQITPEQKAVSPFFPGFWDNQGWGFGLSVITRRTDLSSVPGRYGWTGGYGTSWYVDPKEELIGVLMIQRVLDTPYAGNMLGDFWTSVYQALDD